MSAAIEWHLHLRPRDAGPSADHDDAIRAGIIVPFLLATAFTIMRAYARFFIVDNWGWDDSTIAVAWLMNLIVVILWCVELVFGQATFLGFVLQYSGTLAYEAGVFVSQISVLLFYLRLLPRGRMQVWTRVTLAVVSCASIPSLICTALVCNTATGLFPFNPNVACVPPTPLLFAGTAFVAVIDIWLMVIIIPVMMQLQLPRRQRIALMGIMSGGVIVIIASIVRVILLINEVRKPLEERDAGSFLFCSCIQLSLGIFCAAAPGTVPLWRKLSPRMVNSLSGGGTVTNGYGSRAATTRIRTMNGAIELNGHHDQAMVKTIAHTGRSRSQQKKTWFSGHGDNESQEDVLPGGGPDGILKTSEVVFTEMTLGTDEGSDTTGSHRKVSG